MKANRETNFWNTVTIAGPIFVFILVAYLLKEYTELSRILIASTAFGFAILDYFILKYVKSNRDRN